MKKAGIHRVSYEQRDGLKGLAVAIASVVAAMPDIVSELATVESQPPGRHHQHRHPTQTVRNYRAAPEATPLLAPLSGPARPVDYAFAFSGLRSRATHSTWWVIGKQSYPRSSASRQPSCRNVATSRARAAGSQAT